MAHLAVVWAKIAEDEEIRGFIVEKGTKGYSTRETHHKLSLRASDTSELFFEDCLIPEENILSGSKGLKSPLMCLTQARYGIAWGTVGAAMSCFDTALKYSKQRIQFGKPLAAFQLTPKQFDSRSHVRAGPALTGSARPVRVCLGPHRPPCGRGDSPTSPDARRAGQGVSPSWRPLSRGRRELARRTPLRPPFR